MRIIAQIPGPQLVHWCPGCLKAHIIPIKSGEWSWNEDFDNPTITPSIRHVVNGGNCHYTMTGGQLHYSPDSIRLAGQTLEMPELPNGWWDRAT